MPYLAGYRRPLGDVDDLDLAIVGDPRAAYTAWVAAVKQAGGVATTAPHLRTQGVPDVMTGAIYGAGQAVPAARYPVAFVFPHAPSTELNPLFHALPDDWSDNGAYVYYAAPANVQQYTDTSSGGTITQPQQAPGEGPTPMPKWYDDVKTYLKVGGAIAGGLVLLTLLSYFPHPRNWD